MSVSVIRYINTAHFIDHYSMLVFATAVILMAPTMGMDYAQLLPYATPGLTAFGAGSLLTGWLGDTWSRPRMMAVFFFGIGLSLVAVGLTQTPLQLGAALLAVGLFASIYHPVGTAMLVAHARKLGRDIGINGVWGNLGVAFAALITGLLGEYFGWRATFIVPGVITFIFGIAYLRDMEVVSAAAPAKNTAATTTVARHDIRRVILALVASVIAISVTFNSLTLALPRLFTERLSELTVSPAALGIITAAVYSCGALAQYTMGQLLDRYELKQIFVPLSMALAPLLYFGSELSGVPLIIVTAGIIAALFSQVTINDAMVGRYTHDRWRARAYSVRYFVGFSAAGASAALVAKLHDLGGFTLALRVLAAICMLVIVAALAFPSAQERKAAVPGSN